MATLYTAPAAQGKTAYVLQRARSFSPSLEQGSPRVIVPSRLAAAAFERRLAEAGGALGVWVGTFDNLYRGLLDQGGQTQVQLSEPVQKQLIRQAAAGADLTYYHQLAGMPGFIEVLADLFRELKAGMITPQAFQEALQASGNGPRLLELARVYQRYQDLLIAGNYVDYLGAGWAAWQVLNSQPEIAADWPLVLVDGFDDFPPLQLEILGILDQRVGSLEVTLTGAEGPDLRGLVHQRFNRTRQRLGEKLDLKAASLPEDLPADQLSAPLLLKLEERLFTNAPEKLPPGNTLSMLAVPDRESEVRAALRWLKVGLAAGDLQAGECALLARDLAPYRPYLKTIAGEFGIPLQILGGAPVLENPAVSGLLELLQLVSPGEGRLAWQAVVEAWRSPYFDWSAALVDGEAVGIQPGDPEALAWIARWGSVLEGEDQWLEIFGILAGMDHRPGPWDEEYPEVSDLLPIGEEAAALGETFSRFTAFLEPPSGQQPLREFAFWLEDLIGAADPQESETPGLGMIPRILDGPPELVQRDLEALRELKNALRGLVWAEEAAGLEPLSYPRFLEELETALAGAKIQKEAAPIGAVLAAEVTQARGLSWRAVALLGLAEGEFPSPASEDPFLRDADRQGLRENFGLPLQPSTESADAGYFYEALSRARERLLLTRPRIAENGSPWQPSPYWEEILRLVEITPQRLTTRSGLDPGMCASWRELFEGAARDTDSPLWDWSAERQPEQAARIELAALILDERTRSREQGIGAYDGGLIGSEKIFYERFQPENIWSASRLETYRTCPYFFYTTAVLNLEATEPPREGLDARQLGNLYHRILEEIYRQAGVDPDLPALLEKLPEVAEGILEDAPRVEGFRATAWWEETRKTILENLRRSIEVLENLDPAFGFFRSEQSFGISQKGGPPLVVSGPTGDYFQLRGFIDRVDRTDDGRVRIVDYKTSSPYAFTSYALRQGKKLQLPLYALAAQEALNLGTITEGFYFHVRQAQPSQLRLASFNLDGDRGPQTAMEHGVQLAWEAVQGARAGEFVPEAPRDGCPTYCPAAAYCWHYAPVYW